MTSVRYAAKVFNALRNRDAQRVESYLLRKCQEVGYSHISRAIEYSPAWMTGFLKSDGSVGGLSFEGMCRFLAAIGFGENRSENSEQLALNEIAYLALKTSMDRLEDKRERADTLTDKEIDLLMGLARLGSDALFSGGRLMVDRRETSAATEFETA